MFKFGEKTVPSNLGGTELLWPTPGPEVWTVSHYNEVYPQNRQWWPVPSGSFSEIAPWSGKPIPETDVRGRCGGVLGATYLQDGTTLFGFYHPRAARVYLVGNFNNWQSPYHERPEPELFLPMQLYLGYKNEPNLWLLRTELPDPTDPEKNAYQYLVVGGVPLNEKQQPVKLAQDPYARRYGTDYNRNDCLVIDPSAYQWHDQDWVTPPVDRLILYEFNVYGFTDQDPDLPAELAGTFRGTIHRLKKVILKI